jgi:hypothetical protein
MMFYKTNEEPEKERGGGEINDFYQAQNSSSVVGRTHGGSGSVRGVGRRHC